MSLKIATGLTLPIDAVTEKFAWIGRTGSGKTYGCKRFVEQMLHAGAQVLVLDTMGMWAGLRVGPKAFDVHVFGGLHGDIELEPTAGAVVADVVVDHGISVVLDVSLMTDADRTRFVTAFGARFFHRKRRSKSAVHVVLDEGQDIVPQEPQRGEENMLHEWHRIAKQGRALGIGVSIVTQRPQEVNKKALNQVECVFAFQLTGPQERKALTYWLHSKKGSDERLDEILPTLERGAPHVWSPSWLKVSRVVKILPIDTLDTSQTPKVGERAGKEHQLAPINLGKVQEAMAATLERAKQEDPKLLRARIAELEKLMNGKTFAVPKAERVEVPVFNERAFLSLFQAVTGALDGIAAGASNAKHEVGKSLNLYRSTSTARLTPAKLAPMPKATRVPAGVKIATGSETRPLPRKILTALAQCGPDVTKRRVALLCGVAVTGGYFRNTLSAMRTAGQISGSDRLSIEDPGVGALGHWDPLPTGAAALDHWAKEQGGLSAEILYALDKAGGELERLALAAAVGKEPDGGYFRNTLSALRTLELVSGKATIVLSEELRDG